MKVSEMVREFYSNNFSFEDKKTLAYLCENTKVVKQKKREQLPLSKNNNGWVYILVSGVARCYTINEDGDDISFRFSYEPASVLMTEQDTNASGDYFWESLSDAVYLILSYKVFREAFDSDVKFRNDILQNLQVQLNEEVSLRNVLMTLQSKERYLWFLEHHEGFPEKVPQKFIASYLNMLPQTLSEVRSVLKQEGRL